ncbi:MAG: ATP-binding protein [Dethiosulfatibacter sp.]|nr:ATP-binding protein [Dethiosulfatibacter sp.]
MKELIIPPYAPVLMESTRALGYTLEAAIADILDNSITADSSRIDILFEPCDNPYFCILDNGTGLDDEELNNAMRYGSRHPNEIRESNDLGRFGLGLKTASLSQCRCLTVVSMKNGKLAGRRWDLDFISQRQEWVLLELSEDDINEIEHIDKLIERHKGTLVIWTKLDRIIIGEYSLEETFNKKMPIVRDHLEMVFHRYLKGEQGLVKIEIFINNNPLQGNDPFLIEKSYQILDDEKIIINGSEVLIKPYILPHMSNLTNTEINRLGGSDGLRNQQGFYIYRNKRLVVWGTWFRLARMEDSSKLARVMVDIPNSLDEQWTLDIRKSVANPPDVVKKSLKRIVDKIALGSKRVWVTRGKRETESSNILLWHRFKNRDGTVQYDINREYPLIENLMESVGETEQKQLLNLLRLIELNIPMNALRVDFSNDCKVSADDEDEKVELIKKMVAQFISTSNNPELLIEKLMRVEPFANYPELLKELLEEVY